MEKNIIQQLIISAKEYFSQKQFYETIKELNKLSDEDKNNEVYQLLAENYMELGDLESASNSIEKVVTEEMDESIYKESYQKIKELLEKKNLAIIEITKGKHSTEAVSFIKENTKQLIENCFFEAAKNQLSLLAIARKAKTTNILWIGAYLKEIYFHPKALDMRENFDHLLLSEITFYYLKSCKLFEPEYGEIQDVLKRIKEKK